MFHTYVTSVLQWFQVFFKGVFASVSDACFMCFICIHTYVVSVASRCFKSRLGVAYLSSSSAASYWCLLLAFSTALHPAPAAEGA
jgi:hypothetical protein